MALEITGSTDVPSLLFLPWDRPLEEWPDEVVVSLPRGISRHIVRFVPVDGQVYAVKEIPKHLADHEYKTLGELLALDQPTVEPVAVVSGRTDADGNELESCLITRHLAFSLPYRALFSSQLRARTMNRLLDALVLLIVRLHLAGFAWNDCSLSNTLYRRDAGTFAAYLVDAETGELRNMLSKGQREYDIDTAVLNIGGELYDIEASGKLDPTIDAAETAESLRARYQRLWAEITEPLVLSQDERYKYEERVERLNALGFDVAEVSASVDQQGARIIITPKVVEPGHHSRQLQAITGLDVEENQARRLLNDVRHYAMELDLGPDRLDVAGHRWLADRFEPVLDAVPRDLRGKLEPAQVFHEVLEHAWFLSEKAGADVGLIHAAEAYVRDVLADKPDELAVLGARAGTPTDDTRNIAIVVPANELREPDATTVRPQRTKRRQGLARYFARRALSTANSAMPAATAAFSDSVVAVIGIRTTTSQFSATSRERPLPSEPITSAILPLSKSTRRSSTVRCDSPARPTTNQPAFCRS